MTDGVQLGLFGESRPEERWLSEEQALELFRKRGADERLLLARSKDGAIRMRLNGSGPEFYPSDVEKWAKIEGDIADGRRRAAPRRQVCAG